MVEQINVMIQKKKLSYFICFISVSTVGTRITFFSLTCTHIICVKNLTQLVLLKCIRCNTYHKLKLNYRDTFRSVTEI